MTTTTHKTLRGPRGGMVLCRAEFAKDLDRAVFPGIQGGPLMHVIAGKAVCFKEALTPEFRAYQHQVVANASRMAQTIAGAGFRLVSGGTDNHMMLVDVFSRGLTGKLAEAALGRAGITVNKNAIPFDKNPPMTASGIRIGTPAVTTRGMREPEMDTIARLITRALESPDDAAVAASVQTEVEALCHAFPSQQTWFGSDTGRSRREGACRRRRARRRDRGLRVPPRSAAPRTGGRAHLRKRRYAPGRSRHRHGQDARVPAAGGVVRTPRAHIDRNATLQDQVFYKDDPRWLARSALRSVRHT